MRLKKMVRLSLVFVTVYNSDGQTALKVVESTKEIKML